jgi:DNA invertase Pin-like site-specific DNA recombinase
MLVGYARVSTQDQGIALQCDALEAIGGTKIFSDVASGATTHLPSLEAALEFARQGDTLVVWKLDRLGRSLKDLIERVNDLQARGVGFKSVQENIDTTTANGQLFFHIFGAIAQFERELIRERTLAGLQSARARGRLGGRPQALDARPRALAVTLYHESSTAVKDICATLGISKATLYRYVDGSSRPS